MPFEIDPEIMRRSLPADIHATVDQVTTNAELAANKIIQQFVENAQKGLDSFEKRDFTGEIGKAVEEEKRKLTEDLVRWQTVFQKLEAAANSAAVSAKAANVKADDLEQAVKELSGNSKDLKTALDEFRTKVDTFAEKSGGFIAKAAIRGITGGAAG